MLCISIAVLLSMWQVHALRLLLVHETHPSLSASSLLHVGHEQQQALLCHAVVGHDLGC